MLYFIWKVRVIVMTQKGRTSKLEKDELRQKLCVLLIEGINKDGESKNSPFGSEVLHYEDTACERVGLYY